MGPLATTAEERLEVGSLSPKESGQPLPSAAFSCEERNEGTDLRAPTEKTEISPQRSRGRREGAGLGRGDHSGGGACTGVGLCGPDQVQDLRDPVRGRVARGRDSERGGATAVLATHRLVRLPPHDWTRPSFHTLAPAGLIRDLDGVVQLSRSHGEGASPQHGPPPELPLARPRLTREPPGCRPITTHLSRRCPIPERRSVTSSPSNRRVSLGASRGTPGLGPSNHAPPRSSPASQPLAGSRDLGQVLVNQDAGREESPPSRVGKRVCGRFAVFWKWEGLPSAPCLILRGGRQCPLIYIISYLYHPLPDAAPRAGGRKTYQTA